MKSNMLELARSQSLPTESGLTASEIEQMLRLEWWLNHGHSGLYGDDGEMQCSTCPADFKRQPLQELESLVCVARMTAAAPARPTSRIANLLAVSPHERGGPMPNLPSGYHRDTPTIIQRARGLLADGVDFMAVGNFAATYAVLAPLAKQDIGAIFGYLMKSVDSRARREALAEQRRSRSTAPLLAVAARGG